MKITDITKLITEENNEAVSIMTHIVCQDEKIQSAVKSLNNLIHCRYKFQFEKYGDKYGLNKKLMKKIEDLKSDLEEVYYGRW